MTKPTTTSATAPRLCPTCGTRVGAAATKCLVCGADLTLRGGPRGSRVRALTAGGMGGRLVLPLLLALLVLVAGGTVGVLAMRGIIKLPSFAAVSQANTTPTVTATQSPAPTVTATATPTETPEPTGTPLPPAEYQVQQGDTCLKIAAEYNVSSDSIIRLNQLDPNCTLIAGRVLLIPQPTSTPSPFPTATLGAGVATQIPRTTYTVHSGDTLAGIAKFYQIPIDALMEVNGITNPNSIFEGQVLIIPLELVVTPGPTPTPTPPPPWPAPNPLLPNNGEPFGPEASTVTLQWTSVGNLRPNEYYYVVIEDITCNCARFHKEATTETKLIVPESFQPTDGSVHTFFWTVTTVRQRSEASAPSEYDPAGGTSPIRAFSWASRSAP